MFLVDIIKKSAANTLFHYETNIPKIGKQQKLISNAE